LVASRSRRNPLAGFILPCQPLLVDRPLAGSDWLHEIKHDGYRILARKEGSRVTLSSRHGMNFTGRLPKVAEAVCSLAADSTLIDGEAVTFRSDGHSDFAALRIKAQGGRASILGRFGVSRGPLKPRHAPSRPTWRLFGPDGQSAPIVIVQIPAAASWPQPEVPHRARDARGSHAAVGPVCFPK
jgi:hypothetical protein